jgi:hypothetical protein
MKPQYIKINEHGSKFYFSDEKMQIFHREDGPAVEWRDGSKFWYRNDVLHREDGPAVEWAGRGKQWWIDGKTLTEAQFKKATKVQCKGKTTKKTKTVSCNGKKVTVDGVEYTLTVK